MQVTRLFAAVIAASSLSGCLAKTAFDVATAPVKIAGKAVDMATTSQSEADEKRGRELRKLEQRYRKLSREEAKDAAKCQDGDQSACMRRDAEQQELDELRMRIPVRD